MLTNTLYKLLIALLMTPFATATSQNINGVYRLSGAHEMVAIFEFLGTDSFEFGYVYGAVDRTSSGHYTIRNGKIFLQANKQPGKDFTVAHQEKRGAGTTINISDPNSHLVKDIVCVFKKDGKQDVQYSDEAGKAHSSLEACDSIYVMHQLFPDAPSLLPQGANNYFELTLNPSLAEVSFKDFSLSITREGLVGVLPYLFEKEKAVFVRQER
jgi:hypothetical protein